MILTHLAAREVEELSFGSSLSIAHGGRRDSRGESSLLDAPVRRSRLHAVPANEVFATIHVEILVSAVLAIHATDERFAVGQIFERVDTRFTLIVGGVDRFVLVLEWQEIAVPSSIIDEEFAGLVGHLVEDEELRFVSFIVSVHALRLVVGKLEVVALVFRRFVALILEVVVLLVRDLIDGQPLSLRG